jgi:hypothetical protein
VNADLTTGPHFSGEHIPGIWKQADPMRRRHREPRTVVAGKLDALAIGVVPVALGHGHDGRFPVPRPSPGTLAGLDGRGPVLAASPDAEEVGPASRQRSENLFGLGEIGVLLVADKRQILADGEKRLALAELKEARIPRADAEESLTVRRRALEANRRRLERPLVILQPDHGSVRTNFHGGEPGRPDRFSERVKPVVVSMAGARPAPLVSLVPKDRECESSVRRRFDQECKVHFGGIERIVVRAVNADGKRELLVLANPVGGRFDLDPLARRSRRNGKHRADD